MKVAIAGAGAVGRSIARELVESHEVTLLERNPDHIDVDAIPAAHWRLGDACELSLLESVKLEEFDVMIAATGDDKANVVVSLLSKTEFAVPRVVARVNDPRNEWLFDEAWGVDVAVSTPRMLASLVEEAVSVGDLVRQIRAQDAHIDDLDTEIAVRHLGFHRGLDPVHQFSALAGDDVGGRNGGDHTAQAVIHDLLEAHTRAALVTEGLVEAQRIGDPVAQEGVDHEAHLVGGLDFLGIEIELDIALVEQQDIVEEGQLEMEARIGVVDLIDRADRLTEAQDKGLFALIHGEDALQADEDQGDDEDDSESADH